MCRKDKVRHKKWSGVVLLLLIADWTYNACDAGENSLCCYHTIFDCYLTATRHFEVKCFLSCYLVLKLMLTSRQHFSITEAIVCISSGFARALLPKKHCSCEFLHHVGVFPIPYLFYWYTCAFHQTLHKQGVCVCFGGRGSAFFEADN